MAYLRGRNVVVGAGGHGNAVAQVCQVQQGSRETLALWWVDRAGTAKDLTGAVMTGQFEDADGGEWLVTGVLTPDGDQVANAGLFTWALSAEDCGAPGVFNFYFKAVIGGVPFVSYRVVVEVLATPEASVVPSPPLVVIPQDDAAWLAMQPQVRGFFMQRTVVEADEVVVIPAEHQMIVAGDLAIDGEVVADGDLIII